jgi:hypothetical protein
VRYRLAILVLAGAPFATAGLLVNPAGGSAVGFPVNTDDASVFRSLGGTFSLFGFGIHSIGISSNGFLGTGGNTAGFNTFLDTDLSGLVTATNGPVIAPFFDDLFIRPGSTVTDQSVANTFYAVTYQSMFQPGDTTPEHTSDFQVVLFMADTTVGTFHFLPGDIAFSYGTSRLRSAARRLPSASLAAPVDRERQAVRTACFRASARCQPDRSSSSFESSPMNRVNTTSPSKTLAAYRSRRPSPWWHWVSSAFPCGDTIGKARRIGNEVSNLALINGQPRMVRMISRSR